MQFSKIIDTSLVYIFILDYNNGLLKSVPNIFPDSHYGYCLQHLKCNLRDKLSRMHSKVKEKIIEIFVLCAYESNEETVNKRMAWLLVEGGQRVHEFLSTISNVH